MCSFSFSLLLKPFFPGFAPSSTLSDAASEVGVAVPGVALSAVAVAVGTAAGAGAGGSDGAASAVVVAGTDLGALLAPSRISGASVVVAGAAAAVVVAGSEAGAAVAGAVTVGSVCAAADGAGSATLVGSAAVEEVGLFACRVHGVILPSGALVAGALEKAASPGSAMGALTDVGASIAVFVGTRVLF